MIARHLTGGQAMLAFDQPFEEFFFGELLTIGSIVTSRRDDWFTENSSQFVYGLDLFDVEGESRKVAGAIFPGQKSMALMREVIAAGAGEIERQDNAGRKSASIVARIIIKALSDLLGEATDTPPKPKIILA